MSESRFDRNERLFGAKGQELIRRASVAVVGIGGLGTHVVQQSCVQGSFVTYAGGIYRQGRNQGPQQITAFGVFYGTAGPYFHAGAVVIEFYNIPAEKGVANDAIYFFSVNRG